MMRNVLRVPILTICLLAGTLFNSLPVAAQAYQGVLQPRYQDNGAIARVSGMTDSSEANPTQNVVQAGFSSVPASRSTESSRRTRESYEPRERIEPLTRRSNFLDRERSKRKPYSSDTAETPDPNFGQMISKIGMNLAFVLMLAIGGVLLAKQWMKMKSGAVVTPQSSTTASSPPLQIRSVLQVDAKSTLRLVRCGPTQILVATDLTGIKSVNVLPPSFAQSMYDQAENEPGSVAGRDHGRREPQVDREPVARSRAPKIHTPDRPKPPAAPPQTEKETDSVVDERLIRMLLENSKKRAA